MSAQGLTYNNTLIAEVTCSSSPISTVTYNDTVVFDNSSTAFQVYPEFVPHDDSKLQPIIGNSNSEYIIPTVYLVGNTNFFVRIDKHNAGTISVIPGRKGVDYVYKLDNYGYGILRAIGYGQWAGGSTSYNYSSTITFTPSSDSSLAKSLVVGSMADEDNTVFFKGLYTAKLIRIPSSGITSKLTMQYYPYTFSDDYFWESTKIASLDVSNVGKTINNVLVKQGTRTPVTPADNGSYLTMSITNTGLESDINFSADANNTGQYRYAFFTFYRGYDYTSVTAMYGAEAHFIQEPYSANRIYYGNVPKDSNHWEPYANSPSDSIKYHVAFQYANSDIVTSSITVSMDNSDNTQTRQNVVCVPYGAYTISPSSYTLLTDSYYWGNQRYAIYNLTATTDYTISTN